MTSSPAWNTAESVESWWASEPQNAVVRPFSAAEVALLRDPFQEGSAQMGLVLRALLAEKQRTKEVNMTTSVIDPVSLQMMQEEGLGSWSHL
jgi:isocitrate lyase